MWIFSNILENLTIVKSNTQTHKNTRMAEYSIAHNPSASQLADRAQSLFVSFLVVW